MAEARTQGTRRTPRLSQDQGDEPDAIRLLIGHPHRLSSGHETMLTSELLNTLFGIDTSPWAHWWGETRRGEFGRDERSSRAAGPR